MGDGASSLPSAPPSPKAVDSNEPSTESSQLRFDGKVAVVTGAGNGLGKEFARLLAGRGAKVLVNDLGSSVTGAGSSKVPADTTVAEIRDAGGEAIANYDSVAEGEKIIQAAIDTYGRIDILINNAGISRDATFKKLAQKDWDMLYQVDLLGAFKCTHAAWPHMVKQKYGRIVNISAGPGLFGGFGTANYSAMKGGIVGFSLTLKEEGEKRGICVNVLAPVAATRMMEPVMSNEFLKNMRVPTVAKLATYLCHDSCGASGEIFEVVGLNISKVRWQRTRGVRFSDSFTIEDLADQFDAIRDFNEGAEIVKGAGDMIEKEMRHHHKAKL